MPDASTNKAEGKFEITVIATDQYSEEPQDITSSMKHTVLCSYNLMSWSDSKLMWIVCNSLKDVEKGIYFSTSGCHNLLILFHNLKISLIFWYSLSALKQKQWPNTEFNSAGSKRRHRRCLLPKEKVPQHSKPMPEISYATYSCTSVKWGNSRWW